MEISIDNLSAAGKQMMQKSLDHLQDELVKIRAGKASPGMLSGIKVDYYGTPTPLSQVANVSTPDSKTIAIQPWEKSLLADIEQAIFAANLGLTPMNDGEFVRIIIPPLTEERRKDLVKQAKSAVEDSKIGLRNARQKLMDVIKKEVKDGYPEDAGKSREGEVDAMVKSFSTQIEEIFAAKEKDILTV
jgi:ribosome recycling factor